VLSRAGSSGTIGPNLDQTALSAAEIATVVKAGRRAMPAFGDRLEDDEITAVAAFIAPG
jgi:mono/diheme cytochrome c family protein